MKYLLFSLVLWSGLSFSQTILVYGDSLSAAYGMNEQQGWVHLLAERLGPEFQVINASISGETARGGLARLPLTLSRTSPDLVILELGANDGLRAQPVQQIQAHLQQMIDLILAQSAQLLLLGIQLPPNFGSAYTQPFFAIYSDLAASNPIELVPFMLEGVADQPMLMQADGLHPTAEAQTIILEHIWGYLEPMLNLPADNSLAD